MKNPPSRFSFGKYDIRQLLTIVQKKFVDGFTTVELLKEAQNDEEAVMQLLSYKGNFMNQKDRTDKRLPWQKKCLLVNELGLIEAQTVDKSKMGLGIKTDRTLPLKITNGGGLTVFISGMKLPQAELMWEKKDFNNTTRLGLKFSTRIIG